MGQPLPLPERIPLPNKSQLIALNEMEICILSDNDSPYVEYTLPFEWKMVDCSWMEDLPNFFIIDDKNMKRVSISGTWKGAYDNELRLRILKGLEIELHKKPESNIIQASETSNTNLIGKFAGTFDPFKKPYERETHINRYADYERSI